jgi:hypothetical protein
LTVAAEELGIEVSLVKSKGCIKTKQEAAPLSTNGLGMPLT